MTAKKPISKSPAIEINEAESLTDADLNDLCDATDAAIEDGGGFGWLELPARDILERYWKGVMVMPERILLVARVDGTICGSTQLALPSRNNEAAAYKTHISTFFIAPWARRFGVAKELLDAAEKKARDLGYKIIELDVRETQTAAIYLYESAGFKRWGTNPVYAYIDGAYIAGHYYSKTLS